MSQTTAESREPDIVKVSLDSEAALILREAAADKLRHGHQPGRQSVASAEPAAPPAGGRYQQAAREPLVR